jgi:hypothetical protein
MTTLKIRRDAYLLVKAAHRLSKDAKLAIGTATHGTPYGWWDVSCASSTAHELWCWFDDCEQHCVLLRREAWKVRVCHQAKDSITKALEQA